jgi:hypothetical protein
MMPTARAADCTRGRGAGGAGSSRVSASAMASKIAGAQLDGLSETDSSLM